MTQTEIMETVEILIPAELLARYGHLSYADMAEAPELAAWAGVLRLMEQEWERASAEAAA